MQSKWSFSTLENLFLGAVIVNGSGSVVGIDGRMQPPSTLVRARLPRMAFVQEL
jgi:hypothetical protein